MKRLLRISVALAAAGAAAAIVLLVMLWGEHAREVTLPEPTGPFAVGRVTDVWVNERLSEPFAPNPSVKRQLVVWIWYPASASQGAQRADLLGQGLRLTSIGVLIGLAGALGATRVLSSLLYGISATDPTSFGAVAAVLSVVALLASYLPARWATRVDPMRAARGIENGRPPLDRHGRRAVTDGRARTIRFSASVHQRVNDAGALRASPPGPTADTVAM